MGNDVSLTVLMAPGSAVPEPRTVFGGLLGFGTLAYRTRRRVCGWLRGRRAATA